MALLLPDAPAPPAPAPCGAEWLVIRGQSYRNTAAKFWSRLLDEAELACPGADGISMSAPDERPLAADLLYPERQFERDAEALRARDLVHLMRDLIAQLELYGPPQPVRIHVRAGARVLCERALPLESVDSDVFRVLLAWLLEWAELPPGQWDQDRVSGEFRAEDVRRELTYDVQVTVRKQSISEGLIERRLDLAWTRHGVA